VAQGLEEQRRHKLARAAEKLLDLYYSAGDIMGYTLPGGEDFNGGGGDGA